MICFSARTWMKGSTALAGGAFNLGAGQYMSKSPAETNLLSTKILCMGARPSSTSIWGAALPPAFLDRVVAELLGDRGSTSIGGGLFRLLAWLSMWAMACMASWSSEIGRAHV